MTTWPELVTTALIGTERTATIPTSNLITLTPESPREAQLLSHAAALSLHHRAGHQPTDRPAPLPPACPPDERPPVSVNAHALLDQILATRAQLLPEWLTLAGNAGRRAPHESLPALLDAGRQKRALRPLILPLLDRRGAWLAAQNRDWAWALNADTTTDPDQTWQVAGQEARAALLRELREQDPPRALALLTSTWATEKATDRAAFLAILDTNLSHDDEPLLEMALGDRARDVRATAAKLLSKLPGSRLTARMTARLTPLLQLEKSGPLRRRTLKVTLPSECDQDMQRDGITPKPPAGSKLGERAWWLQQLVASTPPTHWEHEWSLTPEQILKMVTASEWAEPMTAGLASAAIRTSNPTWALALLDVIWSLALLDMTTENLTREFITILPPAERERMALEYLRSTDTGRQAKVLTILNACTHAWSEDLTRAVLARVRALMHGPQGRHGVQTEWHTYWAWQSLLNHAASVAPAHLADEVSARWPQDADSWPAFQDTALNFTATLTFRRDMHKELQS